MTRLIGPMRLPLALALGMLMSLLVAGPASAAVTGTLCGEVTAFTAPSGGAAGTITIDGTVEDIAATAAIDASTITVLESVAAAEATTCLEVEADGSGVIIALDIAAQAEICGSVTLDTATGVYAVGGVLIPEPLVAADADLAALLDAAVAAGATACLDVTIDDASGLIATVGLNATFEVCGEVTMTASSEVAVDGTVIPAELLTAELRALLELAADLDGEACVAVDATSTDGDTAVSIDADVTICATVTAITDSTITLGDVTLDLGAGVDADVEVGDVICAVVMTDENGDFEVGGVSPEDASQAPQSAGGADQLPDTAAVATLLLSGLGGALVVGSGIAWSAGRRFKR
ncbi:MAG: hypothetical protein ACRDGV_02620 [Candidatus Limnocylindria bacterium]